MSKFSKRHERPKAALFAIFPFVPDDTTDCQVWSWLVSTTPVIVR
jgi:hypothetical protein